MAAIRENHLNPGCVMYDMAVRENETIRREDKSRSIAAYLLREAGIGCLVSPQLLVHIDIDNRRADLFRRTDNCPRIGI
jgi:hypothetical protein